MGKNYPIGLEVVVGAVVGDFEFTNLRVYAVYGGEEVTEVPAGAAFDIHLECDIENLNPGWGVAALWTTCMTLYDVTHDELVGYSSFGGHSGAGLLHDHRCCYPVMPDEPTTYRVKIFANQAAWAGAPPTVEW